MNRIASAVTMLSSVLTLLALTASAQENSAVKDATEKTAPIYVKILWPVDREAAITEKDRPAIESWIAKSIENRHKANFRAVSGWVPLVEKPFEATELWDGKLDGKHPACGVYADITERKEDLIKISFSGWGPAGQEVHVTFKNEPGSRDVFPVTQVEMKQGLPHIAIFVGAPVERK